MLRNLIYIYIYIYIKYVCVLKRCGLGMACKYEAYPTLSLPGHLTITIEALDTKPWRYSQSVVEEILLPNSLNRVMAV
jgi:hypothetical protein